MLDYIYTFIIVSFIGWVLEYVITQRYKCDTLFKSLTNYCFPLLTIYGLGAIILLFIAKNYHASLIKKIVISTIIITILECIVGFTSLNYNGYHTWNYPSNWLPFCDGYVSLTSIIWWGLLISLFYYIYEKLH